MDKKEEQFIKMTTTPVHRLVATLAVPTTITMLVTNIYNMADTAFVGQLNTSASGAVGIVFGFMSILQAFGFLFGQGAGSIMSRLLGSKKPSEASVIASTGLFCSFASSVIIAVLSFLFLDQLITLLGSTPTIAPYARTYITYILISAPFIVTSFTMNNLLRFEGKAIYGMVGLMTGAVLNIIGDPIFMFVFHMGIAGAGLSTCLSQIVGFCILIYSFLSGKTTCRLKFSNIKFGAFIFTDIVPTGLPSLLRQGLQSLSVIVLNYLSQPYGDAAISAMSITSRVIFFVYSVALGIGQGFQPVCAFNFGAGKYDRVIKAYKFATFLAQCFITVFALVVLIFSGSVIGFFRDDADVIAYGTRALQLQCITQLPMPFCTMTEMMLQSTGQKVHACIMSSMKSGLLFIPVLFIMAIWRGFSGIQEAQPIANILMFIPSVILAYWFLKVKMPKVKSGEKG